MKAVTGDLPVPDDRWAHEIKWDGMRIVAFVDPSAAPGERVRLQSANLRDVTVSFPELDGLVDATGGKSAVLDGEIVAPDPSGKPSFSLLQQRMHVASPVDARRRADLVPTVFQIFDLLSFDGTDARSLGYVDRRRLVESLIEGGPRWRVPAHHVGGGADLLEVMAEQGMEGVVSKRLDSTYESGRRSSAWIKVKVRRRQEFVIGGWAPGEGRRANSLGSILVGFYAGPDLMYAGRVGTGFDAAELGRLLALLTPTERATSPFSGEITGRHAIGARWVEPVQVCEVAYAEFTGEGRLRHPSYLGLRHDKDPSEVTLET